MARQPLDIDKLLNDLDLSANPLEMMALSALAEVANDQQNQGSSRASAARTLLEYMGKLGAGSKGPETGEKQPISGMSLAEIDRELAEG